MKIRILQIPAALEKKAEAFGIRTGGWPRTADGTILIRISSEQQLEQAQSFSHRHEGVTLYHPSTFRIPHSRR